MDNLLKNTEKYLKRSSLLYFKHFTPPDTLDDFLENFWLYNNNFVTYRVKSETVHCGVNRMRSLHDIYGLVRYYYPKTDLPTLLLKIFTLVKQKKWFGKWLCSTIKRYVFSSHPTSYDSNFLRDGYISIKKKITIKELSSEVGFSYEKDFKK